MILEDGIVVDPEKIKAIMEWHVSKNVADIISFIGITSYYRRFIKGFFKIVYPITSLQERGNKIYLVSKMPGQF